MKLSTKPSAKELVERARIQRVGTSGIGSAHYRAYCSKDDIAALLDAGALYLQRNIRSPEGHYGTDVAFVDENGVRYIFRAITDEPI